jgi:hypothetical protein
MKRKRSEGYNEAPRDSTTQKCLESRYAEFPITGEASLLSTKRTPPTPCCQHCAEHCSRASLPSPPSPPGKRCALSLNPPTPPTKRLRRSTSQPLQRESPQANCLQHDYSTSRLPLTEENLRALVPITSVTEKASPMSTPRNPSPTRKESVRTHLKRLAGYNITFDHGTPFPNTLAQFVKTLEIPREEAPSPHAQAVVDTRRAAAMENESTGRRMMEGHLLFYSEAHADGMPGLTLKDQVNLVRDYLPPPPRPTVPELWGTLPRPQPDSCLGYITATEAKTHNPPLLMPFSREEDDIAEWCVVHSPSHYCSD